MPVYNPSVKFLDEAIWSVRNQLYKNWQFCIADDASTNPEVHRLLRKHASEDDRIEIIFRSQNGHISEASNSAFEIANGDYVALLDHDDLYTEDALYWVSKSIKNNPNLSLIYSDEDKVKENGELFDPYFKPDWNQDLFYSHNLVTHLAVFKRDIIKKTGGFRKGFEGAQDYDIILRCIELLDKNQIHHIPRILYHWRFHDQSTAKNIDAKPYAMIAGEHALNDHFKRMGYSGTVSNLGNGYRAKYDLPTQPPLVTIIIPTRNGENILRRCIDSIIEKTQYPNYDILVIDNGSDEPVSLDYLRDLGTYENIHIVRDERPFNYSALNNMAVDLAKGEIICLLNNDTEVISPEWLNEMVSHALRPEIGAVGAKLLYPNDSLQHGGVVMGIGGVAGHSHKHYHRKSGGYLERAALISNFSAVTAACLVIEKSIYKEVGGLNEEYLQIAFNDVDFCLKVLQKGYRNLWTPYAELYHHESISRGYEDNPEKIKRFQGEIAYMKENWSEIIDHDPAYNKNLTLDHEDFSLAWPPRR